RSDREVDRALDADEDDVARLCAAISEDGSNPERLVEPLVIVEPLAAMHERLLIRKGSGGCRKQIAERRKVRAQYCGAADLRRCGCWGKLLTGKGCHICSFLTGAPSWLHRMQRGPACPLATFPSFVPRLPVRRRARPLRRRSSRGSAPRRKRADWRPSDPRSRPRAPSRRRRQLR